MSDVTAAVKTCEYCGVDLGRCDPRRKYCGSSCKNSALWRRHNPANPAERCAWCQEKMPEGKKPHAQYCNRRCKSFASHARRGRPTPEDNKARYQREKERRKQYAVDKYWEDPEAGREYSRQWRKQNPDKRYVQHTRRRARKNDAYVEDVDRVVVFERDNYICQRCGITCDQTAKWPDPNIPTLDHIVALANGGEHSYANSQTLCLSCNCRKGASE